MLKPADGAKPKIGLWLVTIRFQEGLLRLSPFRLAAASVVFSLAGAALADQPKIVLGRYESALRQMETGQCDQARQTLFPNGKGAEGEEVAISDIGDCYLRAAGKAQDPAEAQTKREIGAGWILRAANLGVREAQATAVRLYLDGKVFFVDPYEAGKWYLLWQTNRSQMQLGQVEFDVNLQKQLNVLGGDIWAEARARAGRWKPMASQAAAGSDAP